jgi:hypothetical protein
MADVVDEPLGEEEEEEEEDPEVEEMETIVDNLRHQPNHVPVYAEQIRAQTGISLSGRSTLLEKVRAHPCVAYDGARFEYVPAVKGVNSAKELLALLREVSALAVCALSTS